MRATPFPAVLSLALLLGIPSAARAQAAGDDDGWDVPKLRRVPTGPEYESDPVQPAPDAPSAVVITGAEDGFSAAAAIDAERIFQARLYRTPVLFPRDPNRVLLRGIEPPGQGALEKARAEYEKGKAYYDDLELDEAIEAFSTSLGLYIEQALPSVEDMAELVDAFVYLGATHFLAGDREAAHAAFKSAIIIDPEYVPDEAIFSPPLLVAYQGAVYELSSESKGVFTIVSHPAHSEVWLDGIYRGLTPVTVEGLALGVHYLVVRHRGFVPASDHAEVSPADPKTLEMNLTAGTAQGVYRANVKRALQQIGPQPIPDAVRQLASMFEVGRIIIGRVTTEGDRSTLEVFAYDAQVGALIARDSVEFRAGSDKSRLILSRFADDFLPKAAASAAPLEIAMETPEFLKKWYFWAGTGAAVAILTGLAVGLAASNPPEPNDDQFLLLGIPR